MLSTISSVRPDERKLAWSAFSLLALVMVSHAMLETARDALFLASLPATELPFVYMLVAAASFGVIGVQKRIQKWFSRELALPFLLIGGAIVTIGLWQLLPLMGNPGLYVLYVWSGVLVSLVLVEFWLALGAAVTVQQAKRLFAFIGTGSVLGAIVGFALAAGLSVLLGAEHLLPAASGVMTVAALTAYVVTRNASESAPKSTESSGGDLRRLFERPYVRSVAVLVVLGALTVTIADYIFKASIAAAVPADQLGTWFSTIYLVLNIGALLVQSVVAGPLIRAIGVTRTAAILPATLSLGALGAAIGLGLPAAIGLKAADGTLRHTVTQTARELLFVPLPSRVRSSVKGIIDTVGQRGGQALASVAILGAVAAGLDERALGGVLLILAIAWVWHAEHMREPYLAVFRRTLSQLANAGELDFPELDLASFETLIAALNSPEDRRVVAALEIMERQDKIHLVPALLLYHPSTEVVTAALTKFVRAGRTDFLPIAEQLQGKANPTVHAAVVRARAALDPDVDYLWRMRDSPCRATRTTAAVYLHALGATDEERASADFEELRDHENRLTAERAIAEAAAQADSPLVRGILVELAESSDDELARKAIAAIGELAAPSLLPTLIAKLADRRHRPLILDLMPRFGEQGLQLLAETLDGDAPPNVKRELPRAIGQFPAIEAVPILLTSLRSADGFVKYRIIRQLEALMRVVPELGNSPNGWGPGSKGHKLIQTEIDDSLRRTFAFMDQRLVLQEGVETVPARATDEQYFLERLLQDKQRAAEERLVRLIGLTHPEEDFRTIWRGLHASGRVRASSQELLDNLLVAPLRRPVIALFDDVPDEERLAAGREFAEPAPRDYEAVLSELVESDSVSVSALAVAQIGRLRLTDYRPQLERLPRDRVLLRDVIVRALALLTEGPVEGAAT